MASTLPLVHYLYTRLHQFGFQSVHRVPSDYNLVSLDYLNPAGLKWIGDVNELDAGNSLPLHPALTQRHKQTQATPPTDLLE